MLYEISKQIEGHTICALGDGAAWPVQVGTLCVSSLKVGEWGEMCDPWYWNSLF
jgi:hypothetical protein